MTHSTLPADRRQPPPAPPGWRSDPGTGRPPRPPRPPAPPAALVPDDTGDDDRPHYVRAADALDLTDPAARRLLAVCRYGPTGDEYADAGELADAAAMIALMAGRWS